MFPELLRDAREALIAGDMCRQTDTVSFEASSTVRSRTLLS
jgi:hypothetical protein